MFKYSLLLVLFPLLYSCTNAKISSVPNRPNIVLMIGDDHGYPYFGFMGSDKVITPHLDKLASSGFLFTNGYVSANHCRPSLQSLMTGMLPIRYDKRVDSMLFANTSRMRFRSAVEKENYERDFRHNAMSHFSTLVSSLDSIGYRSFQAGKWWEFHYENGGFSHGMTTGWSPEDKEDGATWFSKFMGGEGLSIGKKTMKPVFDFIEEEEAPFFLWFAPELPHYPFDAPDSLVNLYPLDTYTISASEYYANCTRFDKTIGLLVDKLVQANKFENTLFIYVNDNGWEQDYDQEFRHDSLRWHNGGDKGKLSVFDPSFRTPIFFSWSNVISEGKNDLSIVESVDIPTTILDVVGLNNSFCKDGSSLAPLLFGEESAVKHNRAIGRVGKVRDSVDMMGRDVEGFWLRDKDWFFQWIRSENIYQLFDMNVDPMNDIDLSTTHPDLVDSLQNKIIEWESSF